MTPDDAGRMREFLASTSEDARYNRFHKWVGASSDRLIAFLTDIDYDRHMAFVCASVHEEKETIVGEARCVAGGPGGRCDFGVLVSDAWRKSGIAGLLMHAVIAAARERGLAAIESDVLADNAPMLRFAHSLGFAIEPAGDDRTEVHIVMPLAPPPSKPDRPTA